MFQAICIFVTVIFLLPGKSYSGEFLTSWSCLLQYCHEENITYYISQKYNPVIQYCRSQCLGASNLDGEYQVPFGGKVKYDLLLWIDSDIIFTINDFKKLISHQRQIIGGFYSITDGNKYPIVKEWNEDYFRQHGTFKFLTPNDIQSDELIEVIYAGMGFMMVKSGVFEELKYPWFYHEPIRIGTIVEMPSEDLSFCLNARKAGFQIWVDPTIRVKQEKTSLN
jgi:hypothetical protein